MIEQAGESLYNRKHTITISGGDKMPGLCHRIIDLTNVKQEFTQPLQVAG